MWGPRKPAFIYPIPPAPRTAVLSALFRPRVLQRRGAIRTFDPSENGWIDSLKAYAPQAIAGFLQDLDALAGRVTLTHATVVFRTESDPLLSDEERDRLWRAFRVPAFEQIIAADGTLLAAECEAHVGLHIESPNFPVKPDEIVTEACPCGRGGPRLRLATGVRAHTIAAG